MKLLYTAPLLFRLIRGANEDVTSLSRGANEDATSLIRGENEDRSLHELMTKKRRLDRSNEVLHCDCSINSFPSLEMSIFTHPILLDYLPDKVGFTLYSISSMVACFSRNVHIHPSDFARLPAR